MKKTVCLILTLTFVLLCFSGCLSFNLDFLSGLFDEEEEAPKLPEKMPADFTFSIKWGNENGNYDASTGVLKKPYGDKYVTNYVMSQEELETVYSLIYDLDILSYEDELSELDYQQVSCGGLNLLLSVKADGITKTVSVKYAYGWYAGKTDKVRKYFNTVKAIGDMLEATDEWHTLPPSPYL